MSGYNVGPVLQERDVLNTLAVKGLNRKCDFQLDPF